MERPINKDFSYEIREKSVALTYYKGTTEHVRIPDEIEGLPVEVIGYETFCLCSLTALIIPASVISIEAGVLANCTSITAIIVDPRNPKYSSNEGVLFSNNQKMLEAYPCGKKGAYTIPDTVERIQGAFYGCANLTSLVISASIVFIVEHTFSGCVNLTSVSIPASVEFIGMDAFAECDTLTAITVDPRNLKYSSNEGVLFSNNQKTLEVYPRGKKGAYTIPASVETIAKEAFSGCGLTGVVIPDSVEFIGYEAFSQCRKLTAVFIPASVEFIGKYAFAECDTLTAITVDPRNPKYSSNEGVLFDKDQKTLEAYPRGRKGAYTIPDSVKTIGWQAFCGCKNLTGVVIPDSVKSIKWQAFSGCDNLTGVVIPDSVKTIEREAFCRCKNLTAVFIPASVESIRDNAFSECENLTAVTLSRHTRVGSETFPKETQICYSE